MYADRVATSDKRSVRDRLDVNVGDDFGRGRSSSLKRQRQSDDKWKHNLYEDARGPKVSKNKIGAKDLRLRLQKKTSQQAHQGSKESGVRDLREKLSGSMKSQPTNTAPAKAKIAQESVKPIKTGAPATEPSAADAKKVSLPTSSSKKSQKKVEFERLKERATASAPAATGEAGPSSQPATAPSEDELWAAASGGLHRGTYYGTGSYVALAATQSSRTTSPASVQGPQPFQESARVQQMVESIREELQRRMQEQEQHQTDEAALLGRMDMLDRSIIELREVTERAERGVIDLRASTERSVMDLQAFQVSMGHALRAVQDSVVAVTERMLSTMDNYHQRLAELERYRPPGASSSSSTPPPSLSPTPPMSQPPSSVMISLEEYERYRAFMRGGAPPDQQ